MPISDYDLQHIEDLMCGEGTWFTACLLRLIAKADSYNLARIRLAFPQEVAAFEFLAPLAQSRARLAAALRIIESCEQGDERLRRRRCRSSGQLREVRHHPSSRRRLRL